MTTLNVKVCGAHTIIQHPPLCVQTSQTRPRLCIAKHFVISKHKTFVLAMYRIVVSQHTHKVIFAKLCCTFANTFAAVLATIITSATVSFGVKRYHANSLKLYFEQTRCSCVMTQSRSTTLWSGPRFASLILFHFYSHKLCPVLFTVWAGKPFTVLQPKLFP